MRTLKRYLFTREEENTYVKSENFFFISYVHIILTMESTNSIDEVYGATRSPSPTNTTNEDEEVEVKVEEEEEKEEEHTNNVSIHILLFFHTQKHLL